MERPRLLAELVPWGLALQALQLQTLGLEVEVVDLTEIQMLTPGPAATA
jgi:hypothetical protein